MGLFGFVAKIAEAAVKVAVTPVAIVKDAIEAPGKIFDGEDGLMETTGKVLDSAKDDFDEAFDDLTED